MDLVQLDKFIEQLNHIRSCITPGCTGVLAPVKVSSIGLGGAVFIKYKCNGCANHEAQLETSSKYDLHNTSDSKCCSTGGIHCGRMYTHNILQNT